MSSDETGTPAVELIPTEWNVQSNHFIEITMSRPTEFNYEVVTGKIDRK